MAARPFMQVIHILSDNLDVQDVLQTGKGKMPLIWQGIDDLTPSPVVKFEHQFRVGLKSLGRCNLLHPMSFPEAIYTSKRRNARFCTHPRATEHHQTNPRITHGRKLRENCTERRHLFTTALTLDGPQPIFASDE